MTGGTRQDERFPPALAAGSVPVDGRSLADLLAMTSRYAELVGTGEIDTGAEKPNWKPLFEVNEAAVLAPCLAMRCDAFVQDYLDDEMAARRDRIALHVQGPALWLRNWLETLMALNQPEPIALAERISAEVDAILGPNWRKWPEKPGPENTLRSRFFAMVHALQVAQDLARPRFDDALASGVSDPGGALPGVLATTYLRVQKHINGFQELHRSFYYYDMLGMRPRAGNPDTVHLIATRDPKFAGEVVIPKGQLFSTSVMQDGVPVLFAANESLNVSDARVTALYNLRRERDPVVTPECDFGFITSVTAATAGPEIVGSDMNTGGTAPTVALFGGTVAGCVNMSVPARSGLAIASPVLWLAQGNRVIDISIEVGCGDTARKIKEMIEENIKCKMPPVFIADLLEEKFKTWPEMNATQKSRSDLAALFIT